MIMCFKKYIWNKLKFKSLMLPQIDVATSNQMFGCILPVMPKKKKQLHVIDVDANTHTEEKLALELCGDVSKFVTKVPCEEFRKNISFDLEFSFQNYQLCNC
ncbi:hypothetical protein ACHQM5_021924 [Ranunculus cassubicifolius]